MQPFKNLIDRKFIIFEGNNQHDAQEFLTILLAGLSEESSRHGEMFNIIEQSFRGETRTTLECKSCRETKSIVEHFHTLSVPIPEHPFKYFKLTVVDSRLEAVSYGLQLERKELTSEGILQALRVCLPQLPVALAREYTLALVVGGRITMVMSMAESFRLADKNIKEASDLYLYEKITLEPQFESLSKYFKKGDWVDFEYEDRA
jgi:hypothetical protein